jgi:hypothetical protein
MENQSSTIGPRTFPYLKKNLDTEENQKPKIKGSVADGLAKSTTPGTNLHRRLHRSRTT